MIDDDAGSNELHGIDKRWSRLRGLLAEVEAFYELAEEKACTEEERAQYRDRAYHGGRQATRAMRALLEEITL